MWPYRKCDASENDDHRRARRQSRLAESQRVISGTLLLTEVIVPRFVCFYERRNGKSIEPNNTQGIKRSV